MRKSIIEQERHGKACPKKEVFDLWTWSWFSSVTILVPKEGWFQQNQTSFLVIQIWIKFYKWENQSSNKKDTWRGRLITKKGLWYVDTKLAQLTVGLNRTSRPVRKSGNFSNVRIPDFRFFPFPDSIPLKLEKESKKEKKNPKIFFSIFFFQFFFTQLFLFIYMLKISPDSVKSGFSPVRQDLSGKFGCPVLSGQETHMPGWSLVESSSLVRKGR